MVLVVYEAGQDRQATAIAEALSGEYGAKCPVSKALADAEWTRVTEWNDLLVMVYESTVFTPALKANILAYRAAHPVRNPETKRDEPGGFIIPVCVSQDPARRRPPEPIEGIRSVFYDPADGAGALAETVRNAGIFLGLALRPGNLNVFISYRATDGKVLAESLYEHLKAKGYHPYLDTAKENDDLAIAAGMNVQEEIRKHIEDASLIVLLDTPQAPQSEWVTKEIDMAIATMVPVLPAVTDGEFDSRFVQLKSLRRAELQAKAAEARPLTPADLEKIQLHLETVLLEGFRRRLHVVEKAKSAFMKGGYGWSPVDLKKRIFEAARPGARKPYTLRNVVLTHCSIHDIKYTPNLQAYAAYVTGYAPQVNQRILIYDRDLPLSDPEFYSIQGVCPTLNFEMVHVSELDVLLSYW